ncbi:MAG: hypothetical protein K8I30_15860, partial [Anaerolineae bacterium]|nr:hypothetical protein [Anaerolineae bacterium]
MRRYWIVMLLLLAACSQAPTAVSPGTFAPALRDQPTQPAPVWQEGVEVITLDNAPAITNIGRLDTASAASTVFTYALSLDATRLAGLNNDQLIVWDLITGNVVFNTSRETAVNVFYSADKIEIFTVSEVGQVAVYDADTGKAKDELNSQLSYSGQSAYYADEGWLALGGLDGSVQIWDPAARESVVTIAVGNTPVHALAFSADGERLATSLQGGATQVWDWRSKQSLANIDQAASRLA